MEIISNFNAYKMTKIILIENNAVSVFGRGMTEVSGLDVYFGVAFLNWYLLS